MNVEEALRGGLEVMRERGWNDSDFESEDGSVCALGGINVAMYGNAVHFPTNMEIHDRCRGITQPEVWRQALKVLVDHVPDPESIPDWPSPLATDLARVARYNNTRKSFAEVEVWFEKAAADERVSGR